MFLKEKAFYDFTKKRTFGRLKGRRLTRNQATGLDKIYTNIELNPIEGLDFLKKKNVGLKLALGTANI